MSFNHIPKGFQSLSPYFCVEDAPGFIEFLVKAFGAQAVFVHKTEDRIVHARIKIWDSIFELSEAKKEYPARKFACQLFVPDCDEVYRHAMAAGAISNGEPADMPYGLRAGYVTDKWGNSWYISTQIEDKYDPEYW